MQVHATLTVWTCADRDESSTWKLSATRREQVRDIDQTQIYIGKILKFVVED